MNNFTKEELQIIFCDMETYIHKARIGKVVEDIVKQLEENEKQVYSIFFAREFR